MQGTRSIRILSLLPGLFDDPIRCKLTVEPIEQDLQYDALSYMWGNPSVTQPITVDDDKTFPATVSLQTALRHLRLQDGVRRLWVDAVALMKGIYSKAGTVRVWIDVNLSPDDSAVRKLLSLSSRSTMDDLGNHPVSWEPLIPLFQSPYWDRLWIQQELLFAKRLEFHCRGVNIPGNSLMKFQHLVFHKSSLGRGPFDTLSDWATFGKQVSIRDFCSRNLLGWRKMLECKLPVEPHSLVPDYSLREPPAEWQLDPNKWGPALSASPIYMLGALRHVRDLKVTDPKDRVHATLGLIIDYEGDNEVWSYEESLAEKYTRIAWLLIFKCNSLRFLADVKLTKKPDPTVIGLPSWVPNWNPPGNAAFFHASFRAAGDIPMFPYPLGGHMEERILNARGFQYDSVRQTLGTRDNSRIPLSQLFTFSTSVLDSCADLSRYFDDLASALIEPSLAKLQLSQSYFRQTEKIFYLYVLHHYAFTTPGLRIADILPYEANFSSQSREDWTGSIKDLQSFHDLLPSDLRMLDLTKLSDVIPQSLDQYQRFGHFIALISQTLGSGCLMSSTSFHLGIIERTAAVEAGDEVWILFGCPIPMILRRDGSAYVVVCPTYVCNIMDGQAVEGIYSPDQFNMWPKVLRTGYFAKLSTYKNSYVSGDGKVYVKVIKLR
ncbi:Heterokaryon incompatibility protein 6, OR allele [Fusarium oxysporum f. sp. cubense race 1]|uniref:Heterokaryon incompatibility protein 6, OR allele n=1 Tax=Fusarium oxysporum f. sp. cubense (strain race 1) TaxID=1229664 RepID=N4V092_FUSC1|nr:Heterokaryon incompatibility protein 6, OR allele [Fusarium oxysporum f. sp. cubense race 1]